MYQCHIQFYLSGNNGRVFDIVKKMPPLENFIHDFSVSEKPDRKLASEADVILADLQGLDAREIFQILVSGKSIQSELILLADSNQITLLADKLAVVRDIWTMPMSEEEIRFRFLRWQQIYKMEKDFWQTSHYLETAINNVPNLVWFKDKNGIHEKVNDSFCRTVNKTKKQVEGQRHAYIWDVDQDDPACIESEREVMTTEKTCVSEETIKTGEGMRLLTTYKSPLYDIDGSVMGTVGIAIDVTQERAYEKEIVEKNRTLETIFTTMDCGVMCHTIDGSRILSINRAALNILGYDSQEDMMSDGFNMVAASVLDEDRDKLRTCIKELKKEGDSISVEYRVRHRAGDIRHVMGNVKLLKENGELLYQRFLLDCTAQKMQEKENERYHMELIHALSIDYNLVCYFDLRTGEGMSLRMDENGDTAFSSVFSGDISLEKCMEQYIEKFVYEEDKELLKETFSKKNLEKEMEKKKQQYINYRIVSDDEMKYYQIKVVRAGKWEKDHGIVFGIRSVDELVGRTDLVWMKKSEMKWRKKIFWRMHFCRQIGQIKQRVYFFPICLMISVHL